MVKKEWYIMKSMIMKSTYREIRQSLGRYLAIMAIVALGVGFFAGLMATKPAMIKTTNDYLNEKQFYDFRLVCTLGFDDKIVEEINRREDVRAVAGAYCYDILCQSASGGNANVIKAYSITQDLNELDVLAGRLPKNPKECVVDATMFSEKYIGKKIKLSTLNTPEDLEHFAYTEYKIVGVVNSPLYIQFERGNSSIGNGKVSGFMYLLPEGFQSEAYTEIYVKLTGDFELYSDDYKVYMEQKEPEWEVFLDSLGQMRYENVILEANEKLADAKEELEDAKTTTQKELEDAKLELENAASEIADGKQELANAKQEIEDALEEIERQERKLNSAEKTIKSNETLLTEKEEELEAGISQWKDGKDLLSASRQELAQGENSISKEESKLINGEQQLASAEAELLAGEQQLASLENLIQDGLAELLKQEQNLKDREQAWIDKLGFIPDNIKEQLETEYQILEATKTTLENSVKELEARRQQLEEGKKSLRDAKAQIGSGKQQIADAKQEINDGKTELTNGEKELASSWQSIKDGRAQIAEGRLELIEAQQQIIQGRRELEEARSQLEEGREEIERQEITLSDGEKEYLDGKKDYEEGLIEFQEKIAEAESEIAQAQEDLAQLEKPEQYLLGRDTNVGYVMFENDSEIVANVATVFPIFFFLVAALVCMTTMSRMIEEQRTQIGTLKALGYSKFTIMGKYLIYSGSAAFIGCVGGFLLGVTVFPYVIWICYGMMYDIDSFQFVFDPKMAMIALVVSLFCSAGTTWYSCKRELNDVAAQLMRPKTPQAGKRIFLERVTFLWKRLKFLQKVSIRNVFRYKKRFFMMVIGISGCAALVLAAFGLKDSIASVLSKQFGEIQIYDMSITLKDTLELENQQELDAVLEGKQEQYGMILETAMEYQAESGTKTVYLVTAKEHDMLNAFVHMHTSKKDVISLPDVGEGVITQKLAKECSLEIGDVIEFQDEDFRTIQITISGIMENFVSNYVYVHPQTYMEQIDGTPDYNTIYLNVSEETDKHLLSADLMKLDHVMAVSINDDTRARFESMMSSLDYIVLLVLACAAALAFIVIYNLTNINITERVREIATIKVLGFYKKETATYVFRENILLTFVGAVVGLAVGKVLHGFIMECIKIEMVTFDVQIHLRSYFLSVAITMFFALCVNKMMEGKLERISMTESLKSVD